MPVPCENKSHCSIDAQLAVLCSWVRHFMDCQLTIWKLNILAYGFSCLPPCQVFLSEIVANIFYNIIYLT